MNNNIYFNDKSFNNTPFDTTKNKCSYNHVTDYTSNIYNNIKGNLIDKSYNNSVSISKCYNNIKECLDTTTGSTNIDYYKLSVIIKDLLQTSLQLITVSYDCPQNPKDNDFWYEIID